METQEVINENEKLIDMLTLNNVNIGIDEEVNVSLSNGAITKILNQEDMTEAPILQILKMYAVNEIVYDDKVVLIYRLTLSDGDTKTSFAFYSGSKYLRKRVQIETFDVVRLDVFDLETVSLGQEKRSAIIIYDLDFVSNCTKEIGFPIDIYLSDEIAMELDIIEHEIAKEKNELVIPINKDEKTSCNTMILSRWEMGILDRRGVLINKNKPLPDKKKTLSQLQNLKGYRRHVDWYITVRVLNKYTFGIKTLNVVLQDETGAVIDARAFDSDFDRFLDIFMIGCSYYVGEAIILMPSYKDPRIVLKLTKLTIVKPCDHRISLPNLEFDFKPINKICEMSVDTDVDIYGVCDSFQTLDKSDMSGVKHHKSITLVSPESNETIRLDLHGSYAANFNPIGNPIIVVKSAKVSKDKNLLAICGISVFLVDPESFPCINELKTWYNQSSNNKIKVKTKYLERVVESKTQTEPVAEISNCDNLGEALEKLKTIVNSIVIIKCSCEIIDTDNQYIISMTCHRCLKQVYDLNLSSLFCTNCGLIERANIKNISTKIRIGDENTKRWVDLPDSLFRKIINLKSNEITLFDTSIWIKMKNLKNKKVNVTLKIDQKKQTKIELTDISFFG